MFVETQLYRVSLIGLTTSFILFSGSPLAVESPTGAGEWEPHGPRWAKAGYPPGWRGLPGYLRLTRGSHGAQTPEVRSVEDFSTKQVPVRTQSKSLAQFFCFHFSPLTALTLASTNYGSTVSVPTPFWTRGNLQFPTVGFLQSVVSQRPTTITNVVSDVFKYCFHF